METRIFISVMQSSMNGLSQHGSNYHHNQQQQQQLKVEESKFQSNTSASASIPSSSCWGETRARFSDVVARSQDQHSLPSSYLGACDKSNNDQTHNLRSNPNVLVPYKESKIVDEENMIEEEERRATQMQQMNSHSLNNSGKQETNFAYGRDLLTKQTKDYNVHSFFDYSFMPQVKLNFLATVEDFLLIRFIFSPNRNLCRTMISRKQMNC